MAEQKYIKSPINYSGSKYRLLKNIIPLFPNNINTFVDLFSGACNVGVNIKAHKIICNDYINYLIDLFNKWQSQDIDITNQYIDETIIKYGLNSENLEAFTNFREHYNLNKNIEDLFILICYSFNYQMRFNNSHKYNSSFGKKASTMNPNIRKNLNRFIQEIQHKNIVFTNNDFRDVNLTTLNSNDFVYADPPYLISGAVYQDGKRGFKGWSQKDDEDLLKILDLLNHNNVNFALSNMLESKGKVNQTLVEWSKKYNIHYLNMNYSNANYQRKTKGKDIEVLITNY